MLDAMNIVRGVEGETVRNRVATEAYLTLCNQTTILGRNYNRSESLILFRYTCIQVVLLEI